MLGNANAASTQTLLVGPEENLLLRLQSGEQSAFWDVWKLHEDYLRRVCFRYLNVSPEDAEDALSTAMLRAFEALPRDAHRISNLRGWLIRLTSNVCIDVLRQKKRLQVGLQESEVSSGLGAPSADSSEHSYIRTELQLSTVQAIKRLPDHLKVPLVLRFLHQTSYRSISRSLGIQEANARKRVQLAKDSLRKQLHRHGPEALALALDRSFIQMALQKSEVLDGMKQVVEIPREHAEYRLVSVDTEKDRRYALAFLQTRARRSAQKEATLRKYIERYPRGWKRRLELAYLLYAEGRLPEALEELTGVMTRQPQRIDIRLLVARISLLLGEKRKARALYGAARRYARNQATVHHLKALRALLDGREQDGTDLLREADRIDSGSPAHLCRLAAHFQATGRSGRMLRATRELVQRHPLDLSVLMLHRSALGSQGIVSEQREVMHTILEHHPRDVFTLVGLIHRRCRLGLIRGNEGRETRGLIKRVGQLAPETVLVAAARADYFAAGKKAEGARTLQEYVESQPCDAVAYLYLARWHFRGGNLSGATTALEQAWRLRPHDLLLLSEAPAILFTGRRMDLLHEAVEAARTAYGDHPEVAWKTSRALLLFGGDPEDIEDLSARALASDPDSPLQMARHGRVLAGLRDRASALRFLERAWKEAPASAGSPEWIRVGFLLAVAYRADRRTDRASVLLKETLERSRLLEAEDPREALKWQARIFQLGGQPDSARRARRRIREFPACRFDGNEFDELRISTEF